MSYSHPEFLAETGWVAQRLQDPRLRVIDVTGMLTASLENIAQASSHDRGHIPGAQFLDVASAHGVFSAPRSRLPWTWPSPEQFEACMGRLGIANDSTVVLYASTPRPGIDFGLMWCTRAWWVMHHYGVSCRVLNGGFEKWVSEGREVSTAAVSFEATRFQAAADWARGIADRDDVLAAIRPSSGQCVVNALSVASFQGTDKVRYGPRKGHISGSVNVPMLHILEPGTGTFQSAEAIRRIFEQSGVDWERPVITYCGGAIAATVDAFALALCGHEHVSVYDGSLAEWSAMPELPMTDPGEAISS